MANNVQVVIPDTLENVKLPSPELVTFYRDYGNRVLWIDDEINDYSLEFVRDILNWNREDKDIPPEQRIPIKIFFFSPGGDLDVNNALIDTIKLSRTPVWGINTGRCASAAAFIYLSCHVRMMYSRSYFLFHQGSGQITGSYQDVCSQVVDYQEAIEELMSFMLQHTNYSKEEIEEKIVGEWYVRKEEALAKGVCDKLVTSIDEIL